MINSIIEMINGVYWKDALLGKARECPCEKCGNPYHFTGEHRWYH